MKIIGVFYAAFGYLALLAAILWGMLFLGDGLGGAYVDASPISVPPESTLIDLGLLLVLALLHRSMSRGSSRPVRSTRAWIAAAALVVLYLGWQPMPHTLWQVAEPLQWILSALFYVACTLIMIGTFLGMAPETRPVAGSLRGPLHVGILIALWVTPTMTGGRLLLASAASAYLLLDSVWVLKAARAGRSAAFPPPLTSSARPGLH